MFFEGLVCFVFFKEFFCNNYARNVKIEMFFPLILGQLICFFKVQVHASWNQGSEIKYMPLAIVLFLFFNIKKYFLTPGLDVKQNQMNWPILKAIIIGQLCSIHRNIWPFTREERTYFLWLILFWQKKIFRIIAMLA